MELGAPYVRARTDSDYWLYANLFSSTCPVALIGAEVVGAAVAFRSQDQPNDIYIQDVMVRPGYRRQGITRALMDRVLIQAKAWGCVRLYLTSEPDNTTADITWKSLGFLNLPGDQMVNGIAVIRSFKGSGKHRAVYQLSVR